MFVGNDSPVHPAVLCHGDDERVCTANSLGRPVRIVVRCHDSPDEALHGNAFLEKQVSLLGARNRPASTRSCIRVTSPGKIAGGYVSTNHTKIELVSMQ